MSSQAKAAIDLMPAPQTLTLLGATGTIGQNTLKIVRAHRNRFHLTTLTGGDNVDLLINQAREFRPKRAVISNPSHYAALKKGLSGTGVEALAGEDAVLDAAGMKADIVMSAIVGAAGLKPTLAAIRMGAQVALANKECLVCAGPLLAREVQRHGATLIPVDSEHSAIFQVFDQRAPEAVASVTITASGGPFRNFTQEQMRQVSPAQAVKHPNWAMGAKISVDSATLMNKGLELIEAFYLFPLKAEQLKVLVHPQSIIHCLVALVDGSVLAQMSLPDMCTPIAYALGWPERLQVPVGILDLAAIGQLQFEAPDEKRFPALPLARQAMELGGNAPTVLNAANEIAVARFLKGEIGFLDIISIVEKALAQIPYASLENLDAVLECNARTRHIAEHL